MPSPTRSSSKRGLKRYGSSISSSAEKGGLNKTAEDDEDKDSSFKRFEAGGRYIEGASKVHGNDTRNVKRKVLCKNPICPHIRERGGRASTTNATDKSNKAVTPSKKVEYQGKEIMQVVEELMEQTSVLKNRLLNMINFFETTIGACASMLEISTEFQHSVCSCASSQRTTGQQLSRTTAGDETSSWHTNYSKTVAGSNDNGNEEQIDPGGQMAATLSTISANSSLKQRHLPPIPFDKATQKVSRSRLSLQNETKSRKEVSPERSGLNAFSSLRSIDQTGSESAEPGRIQTRKYQENSPQNSKTMQNSSFSGERSRSEPASQLSNRSLRGSQTSRHTLTGIELRNAALQSSDIVSERSTTRADKSLAGSTTYEKQRSHISNKTQHTEHLPPIPENTKTVPPCLCAECSLERQMNQIVKHTSCSSAPTSPTNEHQRNGVLGKRTSSDLDHQEAEMDLENGLTTLSRSKSQLKSYYSNRESLSRIDTKRSGSQSKISGPSQGNKRSTRSHSNDSKVSLHQYSPFSVQEAKLNDKSSKTDYTADSVSFRSKSGATTIEDATSDASSNADLTKKVRQVQKEIQELREKMSLVQGCCCACHYLDHENVFAQSMSAQLLGKANQIKGLLNDLKSVCYQQVSLSGEELPNAGQQIVTQKCEKQIRRIHPEFTRTVNQVQNIEATRNKEGDVHNAKVNEALETEIDTKYNDNDIPENINLKTKVEAIERLENISPKETHRQTRTLIEKTVKTLDKAFREVNTVNENDVTHDEGRVVRTTKKVVRTEILEGKEPKERIITNIKIRRVFDNKTGKCTETVTDGDEDSNESETQKSQKSTKISFRDQRQSGGEFIDTQSVKKVFCDTTQNKPTAKSKSELPLQSSLKSLQKSTTAGLLGNSRGFPSKTTNLTECINIDDIKCQPTEDPSDDSISEFMSKKSYEQVETPPTKIRRKSSQMEGGSPSKHWSEPHAEEEGCTLERRPGGTSIRQTCSKVMYVAPRSEIPGVKYIGCKRSDMSKYPGYRSKVSIDKRLIMDAQTSKRFARLSNPSRYSSTRKNYPSTKVSDPNLSENEQEIATSCFPSSAGEQGDPHSRPETPPSTQYSQGATETSSPNKISHTSALNRASKAVFRDRTNSLNRSAGGTSIEIGSGKNENSPKIPKSSTSASARKPGVPLTESIAEIIRKLSGNRSPKDFFVSILPEKIEMKAFRINVIDKETGNLLGHFFVDEEQFKQARDEGVFDNYLSLFVLNSLGSYSDYVKMVSVNRTGFDSGALHTIRCFTKCTCSAPLD